MKKPANFIVTKDAEVANKLIAQSFKLVTLINGTYTFENKSVANMDFDAAVNKKIFFTNILSL